MKKTWKLLKVALGELTNISLQLLLFEFQGFNNIVFFFFQTLEMQYLVVCFNKFMNVLKYLPVPTEGKSCDLDCAD